MSELRWNPLLGTWTMVAANRAARPHLPKNWCPFCPGSGKVPDEGYDVYIYPNDFPALSQQPDVPEPIQSEAYKVHANYGKCEVILYSPKHTITLPELSVEHIRKLVDLWAERFSVMASDENIKYVFEFENRGEEVGVTMPHPHGQIYGYSWIPQKLIAELDNAKSYFSAHDKCLFCQINQEEAAATRVIYENAHFIAYIPYFTDYPYGVFISSKRHFGTLPEASSDERNALAECLKYVTGGMDTLFGKLFPYMMCIHQQPVNSPEYSDCEDYYHFHIEFYPPLREANKIKYYAGSEMGAWAACNPMSVEDTSAELRLATQQFIKKQQES